MQVNKEIIKQSIRSFGLQHQSTIAMEECGELIQAISKMIRYPNDDTYKSNLIEEIADVYIVLNQLKLMYDISDDEINQVIHNKQQREEERIYENEHKTKLCSDYSVYDKLIDEITSSDIFPNHMVGLIKVIPADSKHIIGIKAVVHNILNNNVDYFTGVDIINYIVKREKEMN